METVVSVQARMGSTRLPGKVLLPLAGKQILARIVDRCERSERADGVVVAIGDAPPNRFIEEWCQRRGIDHVTGPEEDLLERHLSVCESTDATTLVRVTGDSPLLPPEEVDRLVAEHRATASDYTTNCTGDTPHGLIVDVVEVDVLWDLYEDGASHPTSRLREAAGDYETTFSADPRWRNLADADLEVDTPEDYWPLTDAIETVGPNALEVGEWLIENS